MAPTCTPSVPPVFDERKKCIDGKEYLVEVQLYDCHDGEETWTDWRETGNKTPTGELC